jgi:hypothetical protein
MDKLFLIDKNTHIKNEVSQETGAIKLSNAPTVVRLENINQKIVEIKKQNNNVEILLDNGEKIVIENFFTADHSLVINGENQELLWVQFVDQKGELLNQIQYQPLDEVEPLLYENGVMSPLLWALIPLTAGGIIAWAANDSDSDSAVVDTTAPSAPTLVAIGNGDDLISAAEVVAGEVDVTVGLPADAKLGDSVIVNGEATVLTAEDITAGEIIVKVDAPAEGETLEVIASIQDAAGNTSTPLSDSAVVDTTAPSAPTLVAIGNGDDLISAAEVVAGEVDVTVGLPVTGVVSGDIVDVNGVEYTLTDADILAGNVTVKVPMTAAESEDFTATATIKDAAGNTSAPLSDSAVVDILVLVDDAVSTSLAEQSVDTTNKLATYNEGAILGVLEGQSQIATVDFTVSDTAKDAVIVVESQNLVTVANAFSFEVVNNATGEVFTVATASSSQGGLVAGALGLQALGVVDDGAGLRLDIKDLPIGDYTVIVHGDSSKLADILETVKLSELGSNTVDVIIQDTVKGLVKEILVNADDAVLDGILKQLTLQEVLDLAKTTTVSTDLINAVESLLATVDATLAVLNPAGVLNGENDAVAAELLNTSVGDIIAGNSTGLLGLLISELGLGVVLDDLVNGLLVQVDNLGEVIYNEVVEPLIDDVITDALLQDTGLADTLDGLLGGVNPILDGLGLGGLLPAADGLLTLVAENILSNPVSLFPDVTADVYAVNEKTYVAEGNVLDNDQVGMGSIITQVNGNLIIFDQTDGNGNYAIIPGTHGTLHLYEDGHYIYTAAVASGETTVLEDQFTYTVQDLDSNTDDAVLTITTDPVNEIIDFSETSSDDILQGGAGNDILIGGTGVDTAVYYLLDNLDATGGNGTDNWTDFEVGANLDKIDVSALLDGQQTATNIGDYISITTNGDGDAVISIDRDGAGTQFTTTSDLVTLTGIGAVTLGATADDQLQALLNNNQIIF